MPVRYTCPYALGDSTYRCSYDGVRVPPETVLEVRFEAKDTVE